MFVALSPPCQRAAGGDGLQALLRAAAGGGRPPAANECTDEVKQGWMCSLFVEHWGEESTCRE